MARTLIKIKVKFVLGGSGGQKQEQGHPLACATILNNCLYCLHSFLQPFSESLEYLEEKSSILNLSNQICLYQSLSVSSTTSLLWVE